MRPSKTISEFSMQKHSVFSSSCSISEEKICFLSWASKDNTTRLQEETIQETEKRSQNKIQSCHFRRLCFVKKVLSTCRLAQKKRHELLIFVPPISKKEKYWVTLPTLCFVLVGLCLRAEGRKCGFGSVQININRTCGLDAWSIREWMFINH